MQSNYLNNLEREFYFVSDEEREQIIAEYEVHFEERMKEGATVAEVISNLGTPKSVAIEYATELDINYSTIDKHMSNIKRDSNVYLNSVKRKMNEIKNEEAAKRRNRKAYSKEQHEHNNTGSTSDNLRSTDDRDKLLTRFTTTFNQLIKKCISIIIQAFYICKVFVIYAWKLIVGFFLIIFGLSFLALAIGGVAAAILAPLFITFINYSFTIWFLFYGSILSYIIFFVTISILCLKRFGSINHE